MFNMPKQLVLILALTYFSALTLCRVNTKQSRDWTFGADDEVSEANFIRRSRPSSNLGNSSALFFSRRRSSGCKCGKKPFADNLFPIFNFYGKDRSHSDSAPFVEPYIVGGAPAEELEFPWMVGIADISLTRQKITCGGALINSRFVLTAAHCVAHKFLRWTEIWFNTHDMDLAESSRNVMRRKVKRFIMHPRYPQLTREHDIALIEIEPAIDFSKSSIRPICLPTSSSFDFADLNGTVAGWGYNSTFSGIRTSTLHKVSIPILSHKSCVRTGHLNYVKPNMLCAGEVGGGKDACYSDSGGPLIVDLGNRNVVAGVVAWGRGCGKPNLPGVYTRVSSYLKWIQKEAKSGEWCHRLNNKFLTAPGGPG